MYFIFCLKWTYVSSIRAFIQAFEHSIQFGTQWKHFDIYLINGLQLLTTMPLVVHSCTLRCAVNYIIWIYIKSIFNSFYFRSCIFSLFFFVCESVMPAWTFVYFGKRCEKWEMNESHKKFCAHKFTSNVFLILLKCANDKPTTLNFRYAECRVPNRNVISVCFVFFFSKVVWAIFSLFEADNKNRKMNIQNRTYKNDFYWVISTFGPFYIRVNIEMKKKKIICLNAYRVPSTFTGHSILRISSICEQKI